MPSLVGSEMCIRDRIYGKPLPHSEWYLISVMPYGMLDESINDLSAQRTFITLLACGSILLFLTLIFLRYFFLTRQQLQELGKARQAALEASKAKSEFLANMSHDCLLYTSPSPRD